RARPLLSGRALIGLGHLVGRRAHRARTPVRPILSQVELGGGDVQEAAANSPDQAVLQEEEVVRPGQEAAVAPRRRQAYFALVCRVPAACELRRWTRVAGRWPGSAVVLLGLVGAERGVGAVGGE